MKTPRIRPNAWLIGCFTIGLALTAIVLLTRQSWLDRMASGPPETTVLSALLTCLMVIGLATLVIIYRRTREAEVFVRSVSHETNERKRSEEALHLRDRAIEAISQGILIIDAQQADRPLIYVNSAFERITGYRASEVTGRRLDFLQGSAGEPATFAYMETAIREERSYLVEVVAYRKDQTAFCAALALSPIRAADGRLTHFVGVLTDVSDQKRLEAQLRQAQKLEAIGRLAGGVAHDFNNVLTVILGYSDMLLGRLGGKDPSRPLIEEVAKAGQRAAGLTNQLLAFSRKQVLTPVPLSLNTLVADMDKMLRRLIGEDIEFTTELDRTVHEIKVDPGQIGQVVMNLVVNARDAMPEGGKIAIRTANVSVTSGCHDPSAPELPSGSYVLLDVSDTGCGMDEATRARIFEPFFTTKEQGMGTGLGLATVYGIIKQSGGYIYVQSEPGCGATFKIYFPSIVAPREATAETTPPSLSSDTKATVLVVEDEDAVRTIVAHALARSGHTVLQARSGADALEVGARHPGRIDLLVTDVVMPQMSGCQLAERLAASRPAMKVLYISGYTDEAIVRHGLLSAQLSFLQKPFTGDVLVQRVNQVLDQKLNGKPRPARREPALV
jgi:PAS domain S-box-containing protein